MPVGRCSFLGLLIAVPMVGCAALYPRFDNPLNPDIAFPNVGDVVDGVKCAVSSYLFKRASDIQAEHRLLIKSEVPKIEPAKLGYCKGMDDYVHPEKWRIALLAPKRNGEPGECEFQRVLNKRDEDLILNPPKKTVLEMILELKRRRLADDEHLTPGQEKWLARLNGRRTFNWPGRGRCNRESFKAYRYVKLKARGEEGYRCEPNGGCLAGTTPQKNGTCAPEDTSRFALDPNSNAKIELTISAVNTAGMNYQRIDATRLDFLPSIIVPGDGPKAFPFPSLKATDKKTNKVAVTVLMPQSILKEAEKDKSTEKLLKALAKIEDETPQPSGWRHRYHSREAVAETGPSDIEQLSRQILDELTKTHKEYENKCEAFPLKVDFLALQRYIMRIVDEQEKRVFGGAPQVALDSLVLTSEFQLQFDATAGTQNLLRIVPVLLPPVLSISPDHTHSLKITFAGAKARGLAGGGISLIQRCVARFRNTPLAEQADAYCRRTEAIHRESIIDAVESSGKGG